MRTGRVVVILKYDYKQYDDAACLRQTLDRVVLYVTDSRDSTRLDSVANAKRLLLSDFGFLCCC